MTAKDLPAYNGLLVPALRAVRELGGSASINEIVATVIQREGFIEEEQARLHNQRPETEVGYRLAWTTRRQPLRSSSPSLSLHDDRIVTPYVVQQEATRPETVLHASLLKRALILRSTNATVPLGAGASDRAAAAPPRWSAGPVHAG